MDLIVVWKFATKRALGRHWLSEAVVPAAGIDKWVWKMKIVFLAPHNNSILFLLPVVGWFFSTCYYSSSYW